MICAQINSGLGLSFKFLFRASSTCSSDLYPRGVSDRSGSAKICSTFIPARVSWSFFKERSIDADLLWPPIVSWFISSAATEGRIPQRDRSIIDEYASHSALRDGLTGAVGCLHWTLCSTPIK